MEPSSFQRMVESQERMSKLFATALPQPSSLPPFPKVQQPVLPNLVQPSGLQAMLDHQAKFDRIFNTSNALDKIIRQQRVFDNIVNGPSILRLLGTAFPTMPTGFVEQAAVYRDELADELATEAVAEPRDAVLSRLAEQREAILKMLNRLNEGAIAAGLVGVPIPNVAMALMILFYIFGDVADEIITERGAEED
jgi:hypothetical protein